MGVEQSSVYAGVLGVLGVLYWCIRLFWCEAFYFVVAVCFCCCCHHTSGEDQWPSND